MRVCFLVLLLGVPPIESACVEKAASVFRVNNCGSNQSGTAFLVEKDKEKLLVTALHNVRHCRLEQNIASQNEKGTAVQTRLHAIDRDADLALLRPFSAVPEPALVTASRVRGGRSTVLAYSHGSREFRDKIVTVQRNGELVPLLQHFGSFWNGARPTVPRPETRVYALEGSIQPGDSGAPLLDADCAAIGVIDGAWLVRIPGNDALGEPSISVGIGEGFAIPFPHGRNWAVPTAAAMSEIARMPMESLVSTEASMLLSVLVPSEDPAAPDTYMTQTEVSVGVFSSVCDGRPSLCNRVVRERGPAAADKPVRGLTAAEAQSVCERLSAARKLPHGARLPTFDEWYRSVKRLQGNPAEAFLLKDTVEFKGPRRTSPAIPDDYGFADLFGNVFEIVRKDSDYVFVGGSWATRWNQVWKPAAQRELIGSPLPRFWTRGVSLSEVGFRCAYEQPR